MKVVFHRKVPLDKNAVLKHYDRSSPPEPETLEHRPSRRKARSVWSARGSPPLLIEPPQSQPHPQANLVQRQLSFDTSHDALTPHPPDPVGIEGRGGASRPRGSQARRFRAAASG